MSAVGLIFLSPFLIAVSVLLYIFYGSPVFFFQKRVGQHKKVFTIFKFRTMQLHAEKKRTALLKKNEAPFPMFKLHEDPRHTKIGQFLSRTGIDELPQLLNILKGEMSFVGPRPLPLYEAGKLPKNWDFRYQVKPGIISEWAINNKRYASLNAWKNLEKITLQETGGFRYETGLIIKAISYITSNSSFLKKNKLLLQK